jgi:hypothetical protein
MGCKCKEAAQAAQKYSDEETMNTKVDIARIIEKVMTGFFIFLLLIVVMPFIVVYVIISFVFKQTVNIKWIKKIINNKNVTRE